MRFVCEMKWDDLQGTDKRRRTCETCDKPVYNLSGMRRRTAVAFLDSHGDKPPCVRFLSVDGEVVHYGDPLAQLLNQRRGTTLLIGAAVAVHLGIAAFSDNPVRALLSPFDACDHVVMGALGTPLRAEPNGILLEPEDVPAYESDMKSVQFARARVDEADRIIAEAQSATSAYREYRALYEAVEALRFLRSPVPSDLTGISRRMLTAEAVLTAQHYEFRAAFETAEKLGRHDEMRSLLRTYLSNFSDRHNTWAEFAKTLE